MNSNQDPGGSPLRERAETLATKSDSELAELAVAGDLDAYGEIIRRHQSLLLSIAFSMCGRFRLSEELAHDAFVSAWRNLSLLKEKDRLKGWLCGIVRNLVREEARKADRRKRAESKAPSRVDASRSWTESPRERLASAEEEAMVWEALEQIPERYREPMVLYYRENQSTTDVARAMDLTEDAVRQRLTRGRVHLKREVEGSLARALRKSAPSAAFRLGVIASISTSAAKWASAASLGAGVGSKVLIAKTAGGVFGATIGTLGGLLGAGIGTIGALRNTPSVRARRVILRSFWNSIALTVVFTVGLYFLVKAAPELLRDGVSSTYVTYLLALIVGYQGGLGLVLGLAAFKRRRILREEGLWDDEARRLKRRAGMQAELLEPVVSTRKLLGIPLYRIAPMEKKWVVAWIAVAPKAVGLLFGFGTIAIGLFGFGALAIGLIGMGGMAIGGVVMAGLAVGGVALGGFTVGVLALGGMSAGVWALGGLAAGWVEALGGLAYSPTAAAGGEVYGVGISMEESQLMPIFETFMKYRRWLWGVLVIPTLFPVLMTRWIWKKNAALPGRRFDRAN